MQPKSTSWSSMDGCALNLHEWSRSCGTQVWSTADAIGKLLRHTVELLHGDTLAPPPHRRRSMAGMTTPAASAASLRCALSICCVALDSKLLCFGPFFSPSSHGKTYLVLSVISSCAFSCPTLAATKLQLITAMNISSGAGSRGPTGGHGHSVPRASGWADAGAAERGPGPAAAAACDRDGFAGAAHRSRRLTGAHMAGGVGLNAAWLVAGASLPRPAISCIQAAVSVAVEAVSMSILQHPGTGFRHSFVPPRRCLCHPMCWPTARSAGRPATIRPRTSPSSCPR